MRNQQAYRSLSIFPFLKTHESASFTGCPPPPTSPPSEGSSTARFGFGYQRPDSRMKTSDV